MTPTRKAKYSRKQKRQSQRIAESREKPSPSEQEGKLRLWSLQNAMMHGGEKAKSGRRHLEKKASTGVKRKGRQRAAGVRPYAPRAAAASRRATDTLNSP